jgi:dolichol-phosphate mannosyltransferase
VAGFPLSSRPSGSGNVAEWCNGWRRRSRASIEEVIFVDDDSPDGTTEMVKAIAASDSRVRCLRRVSRRGLAGACIEGMLSSSAPYVGVMDADLQHDENLLPRMLATLRRGDTDLVVGSRYIAGGNAAVFSKRRGIMSKAAGSLARMLTRIELTDPMSGFFMMRRDADPIAASLSKAARYTRHRADSQDGLHVVEEPYVRLAPTAKSSSMRRSADFLGLLLTSSLAAPCAEIPVYAWWGRSACSCILALGSVAAQFHLRAGADHRHRRRHDRPLLNNSLTLRQRAVGLPMVKSC